MSGLNLIRGGGLLFLAGGVLAAVGFIIHPPLEVNFMASTRWVVDHIILFAALIIAIPGIFAIYARQVKETGGLGLIGFILLFMGHVLFLGVVYFELFVVPSLAVKTPEVLMEGLTGVGALGVVLPVSGVVYFLGYLLFGIAIIRARILPLWGTVLLIIGAGPIAFRPVLPDLISNTGAVIFAIGAVWLGYALWAEKSRATS